MRDFEILNPKSKSLITSEDTLSAFCKANGLTYEMVDISELEHFSKPYCFIHTGETKNQFNGGNVNHWMFLAGSMIFDSYGLQDDFLLPEWCKYVQLRPKRLQEFGSNVCGEYCCTFYKFVASQSDQDDEDLGHDYCDAMGFSENRNQNDRIVQAWFAKEHGQLETQGGKSGTQEKGGKINSETINRDLSRFFGKAVSGDDMDAFIEDLIGPKAHGQLSKDERKTIANLFYNPKVAHENADIFNALWQQKRANPDALPGLRPLADFYQRLTNPDYASVLNNFYNSHPYTAQHAQYWAENKEKFNPGKPQINTTTAPDPIPVIDPGLTVSPATPHMPNTTPAIIPGVPGGADPTPVPSATTEPATSTADPTTTPPVPGGVPGATAPGATPDPGSATTGLVPWTPPGPGAAPPPQTTPAPGKEVSTWFQKVRETLGLKDQRPTSSIPNEIANPPAADFPSNFDPQFAKTPQPLNFPVPTTTPMPQVVRESTIAMTAVENFTPHLREMPNTTTIPVGAHNPVKRLRLDGTLEHVPKKAKGAVTAYNTIQTYVPMPQEVDEITTVPFQHPQFQQLTAVPQLATMDKGFFKAGTNKLNTTN